MTVWIDEKIWYFELELLVNCERAIPNWGIAKKETAEASSLASC